MKLRTLYDCRNHWQWLWITGSSEKRSYGPSKEWMVGCACCNDTEYCENCPLTGYAWSRHCLASKDSLFRKWTKARTKETRIEYARKMVMACNRAIEEELTNSYYYGWKMAETVEVVKYYARKMVMACNRAIEDILCK